MPEPPSHWDNDPQFPVEDWRYEVANDYTRLGYTEWVQHQRESSMGLNHEEHIDQAVEEANAGTPEIWLNEDEDEGVAACGCKLEWGHDNSGNPAVTFCPIHQNAIRFFSVLKLLQEWQMATDTPDNPIWEYLHELLAKVEQEIHNLSRGEGKSDAET